MIQTPTTFSQIVEVCVMCWQAPRYKKERWCRFWILLLHSCRQHANAWPSLRICTHPPQRLLLSSCKTTSYHQGPPLFAHRHLPPSRPLPPSPPPLSTVSLQEESRCPEHPLSGRCASPLNSVRIDEGQITHLIRVRLEILLCDSLGGGSGFPVFLALQ